MASENDLAYPRGDSVPFPRRPYKQQVELMDTMLQAIQTKNDTSKIILLESPTGTGKSLSLACSSLAWLDYQRQREKVEIEREKEIESPTSTTTTGLDWIDEWEEPKNDLEKKTITMEVERRKGLDDALSTIRQSYKDKATISTTNARSSRGTILRQAITKAKIQARKRQRLVRRQKQPLQWEVEEDDKELKQIHPHGSTPWLLQPSSSSLPSFKRHKVIYAARTHSQLTQFVSEVRKTKWGSSLKVIALASRSQGLCGHFSNASSSSSSSTFTPNGEESWTEACLELKQSTKRADKNSTCACPYYHKDSIETLALHALAEPTDLEDWKALGQASQTCSYYASRKALPHADLVVLPYSLLVSSKTRESIGLDLEDSLVIVDEAHNLPQAISNLQSSTLSFSICRGAIDQLENYTAQYISRLTPRHLQFLGQLKIILKAFRRIMTTQEGTGTKELFLPSAFLCKLKLDRINLFPLLRYMADSKLSQKLLGFVGNDNQTKQMETKASGQEEYITKKKKTVLSPMAVVETFLSKLKYANVDGRIVLSPNEHLQFIVLNPAVASEDDLYTKPHALCLVGGTLQPFDVMIQELVPKLAPLAQQAQTRISSSSNSTFISDELVAFSCGHVVPKSNVLLQAITKVDDVNLDIRFNSRGSPTVMTALGKALVRLAKVVPNGMVVFVGSYKYEQALIDHWRETGIYSQLKSTKPVFREPKDSKQTDDVLSLYGEKAKSCDGALLFSVMGGKLSEGINFANELCRCVVVIGLPYPDPNDPLMKEKLKLVKTHSYVRSLCLRSVNQSVGRAIRHANDHACIVLMDVRYPQQDAIANGLPKWLTEGASNWRSQPTTLNGTIQRVEDFFSFHRKEESKIKRN